LTMLSPERREPAGIFGRCRFSQFALHLSGALYRVLQTVSKTHENE